MININTAHSFDANSNDANKIDGSIQMQINLAGLLKGTDTIGNLHKARCGSEVPTDWAKYEKYVIWDYNSIPARNYLPFDISDELELRYRYCIDSKFKSRFELNDPCTAKTYGSNTGSLYDASSNWGLGDWKNRITEPNKVDRRHLLTTCSLDRVITPSGGKMTNINDANVNILYSTIRSGILDAGSGFPDVNKISAQIAVNIKDYRDIDSNVTVYNKDGSDYYGFERPCIYISELACRQVTDSNIPTVYRSYAVELYKPYSGDNDPNGWKLRIDGPSTPTPYDINWSGTKQFYVIKWENSNAPLTVDNSNANVRRIDNSASTIILDYGYTIWLIRSVGSDELILLLFR
jgi:hypothetical protein